jgi:hypothetical protein
LAGRYDGNWRGDYSFICVTGNAQLSVLMARCYQITGRTEYLAEAGALFASIATAPWRGPFRCRRGGVPGSIPVWGAYQPWRFPNWAAKFYLDACLILNRIINERN